MTQSYNKNIFLYNKKDELTTYVGFDDNDVIVGYYNLDNKVLTKINVYKFIEKNKVYIDTKKSKLTFAENGKLFHMFLDGDTYCKVIRQDSLRIEPIEAVSKIYTHNEDYVEGYTLNPSLMQDWLKKL